MDRFTDRAPVEPPERYRNVLLALSDTITARHLLMLQHQYRSPQHTATVDGMVAAADLKDYRQFNLHYGGLAEHVADALRFTPPPRGDGTPMYWTTLSTGDPAWREGQDFRFIMRQELAQALFELGWV